MIRIVPVVVGGTWGPGGLNMRIRGHRLDELGIPEYLSPRDNAEKGDVARGSCSCGENLE